MQGVESMGSALEVSPSAFGGFTIREDFVSAMRLSIRHTQSMPADGKPDSDLQALTVIKLTHCFHMLRHALTQSEATISFIESTTKSRFKTVGDHASRAEL